MLLLSQIVRLSFTNCRSDGRLAACVATLFYEPVINPPRCVTLLLYALRIICVEAIPNEVFKHVHLMVCNIVIDSLHYSVLTSNTELHRLLLDCNETEQEIIIRTARELKATLVSLGI